MGSMEILVHPTSENQRSKHLEKKKQVAFQNDTKLSRTQENFSCTTEKHTAGINTSKLELDLTIKRLKSVVRSAKT